MLDTRILENPDVRKITRLLQTDSLEATVFPEFQTDFSRFMSVPFIYEGNLPDEKTADKYLISMGQEIVSLGLKIKQELSNKGSKLYYGKESFSTIIGSPGILAMISSPNYTENAPLDHIQLHYPDGSIENVQ